MIRIVRSDKSMAGWVELLVSQAKAQGVPADVIAFVSAHRDAIQSLGKELWDSSLGHLLDGKKDKVFMEWLRHASSQDIIDRMNGLSAGLATHTDKMERLVADMRSLLLRDGMKLGLAMLRAIIIP